MRTVITRDTDRDITDIILNEAAKHEFDPIGFVAGAIGESNLNEQATREADWPDVSYGLWQPAVKFLTEEVEGLTRDEDGAVLDTEENREVAREFCFDAERLAAYTAPRYAQLLNDFGDSVEAWCRYNAPGLSPDENPNFDNIASAHERAEQFRDGEDGSTTTMTLVEEPDIDFIGAHPTNFAAGRDDISPEAIVLHIAEGSLSGVDSFFNEVHNEEDGPTSAHFCVGKNGTIHQYVNTADTAFANGIIEEGFTARLIDENAGINPNKYTISIEHEGESGDEVTLEQRDASTRLTAWLFQNRLFNSGATGVDVDRDHILRHADITPISREDCPGWSEEFIADYIATVRTLLGI